MSPFQNRIQTQCRRFLKSAVPVLFCAFATTLYAQQDYTLPNVPYVCNGERLVIENCNIRDTSDTSTCMVGHPDHILSNGLMQYTNMTRQPSSSSSPPASSPPPTRSPPRKPSRRRQQDTYDANVKKANDEKTPSKPAPAAPRQPQKPIDPGRARHQPLHHLRPPPLVMHRQRAPRSLRPDALLRPFLRRPSRAPGRAHHGRSLRRRRRLAPRLHRRRRSRQLLLPLSQSGGLHPQPHSHRPSSPSTPGRAPSSSPSAPTEPSSVPAPSRSTESSPAATRPAPPPPDTPRPPPTPPPSA